MMALVSARRKCLAQKQFDWECDLYRVKESLSTVPANHKLLPQGTKGRNVCCRALKRRLFFFCRFMFDFILHCIGLLTARQQQWLKLAIMFCAGQIAKLDEGNVEILISYV